MYKLISYFIILSCIFSLSCEKDQSKFAQDHKLDLLSVKSDKNEIEADGVSQINLTATLPSDADIKTVSFTTNDGKLGDSGVKSLTISASMQENQLSAVTKLVSTLEENQNVQIKVAIKDIDTIVRVRFAKAFPEDMSLESSVHTIKSGYGSEVPVQTFLLRSVGIPSIHHKVDFRAITDINQSIGEFRAVDLGSNNNGIVNAIFVLKNTTYTGVLRIIATTETKTIPKSDTLNILITP